MRTQPLTMTRPPQPNNNWKILVVDGEEDVHAVTRLVLSDLRFEHRNLDFLEARSSIEAVRLLAEHPDIAVALIDVVMETEGAGLELVRYVRKRMRNRFVRLILHIKRPGTAPERSVITQYEIDDYKTRDELSSNALFTSVFTALRSFRNIRELDSSRRAARYQLEAANAIFRATDLRTLATISTAKALVILGLEQDAYWNDSASAWWVEMPTAVTDGKVLAAVGRHANAQDEWLLELAVGRSDTAPPHLTLEIPTKWGRQFRLCVAPDCPPQPHDRELLELLRLQAILVANNLLTNETHRANERKQMSQTLRYASNTSSRCVQLRPVAN